MNVTLLDVTDDHGVLASSAWLERAESLHRDLRPSTICRPGLIPARRASRIDPNLALRCE
jgi:hypothetical protein